MIGDPQDLETAFAHIRASYFRVITSQWTMQTSREHLLQTLQRIEDTKAMIRKSDALLGRLPEQEQ